MSESNEILNIYTERIKRYEQENSKNYIWVGMNLWEIHSMNLLENTKYKNIKEYALEEFGYEASKTYELINIYEKFFAEEMKAKKNCLTYGQFTISQLKYMLNMDDLQLKECKKNMTIKSIKEILINKKSTRVDSAGIENTKKPENNANNCMVIDGIFPDKIEKELEEKTTTIIVTELPKEARKENKTIVVDVKTEQNDDYAINQDIALEAQQDYYKNKYHEALEEIQVLQENIANENKKIQDYKIKVKEVSDTLVYFHDELLFINADLKNQKIDKYMKEFFEFVFNGKLPKKIYFMKNVI